MSSASLMFPARGRPGTRSLALLLALGSLVACSSGQQENPAFPEAAFKSAGTTTKARNVILMINDGAGWGTWDAAAYWQHGNRQQLPYASFPHRYGMSTYPLNGATHPTGDPTPRGSYDPARAWSVEPSGHATLPVEGYRYLDTMAVDSAAAGTALASGIKTYNRAINHNNPGRPVPFITQIAKRQGKATGVVTSVPFSHATPAAFGAQSLSRISYQDIARQMLHQGDLDLIFGAGAPGFNVNGTACHALAPAESRRGCENPYEFLAEEDWQRLSSGQLRHAGSQQPWTVIRSKADFEALADGRRQVTGPLFGSPEIASSGTLQQQREAAILGPDPANPSGVAFIQGVPTLATLSTAALKHLARHPQGFFLMIEGGATDWAAHTSACGGEWRYGGCEEGAPQYGRLIEETADFNDAVAAVVNWIETRSSWQETLLIVTTDHDNSMPMGPDADQPAHAFQPVENRGKGRMPGFSFRATGNHSNALVPLWAKGAGASQFAHRVRGKDAGFARHVSLIGNDGSYIDNTDVHHVMHAALTGEAPPASP